MGMSNPHFIYSDPSLSAEIKKGLQPDEEKHTNYFLLEPVSLDNRKIWWGGWGGGKEGGREEGGEGGIVLMFCKVSSMCIIQEIKDLNRTFFVLRGEPSLLNL